MNSGLLQVEADLRQLGLPSEARVHHCLQRGFANDAWFVSIQGVRCVLRRGLDGGRIARRIGLDRRTEVQALEAAAALGVAPRIVAFDHERDLLLLRHVSGSVLPAAALGSGANLRRIGRLLRRVHGLPGQLPRRNLAQTISHYEALAGRSGATLARAARRLLGPCLDDNLPDALVHGDPSRGNLIFGAKSSEITLIDWEYASMGSAGVDLGIFLASLGNPSSAPATALLAAYLGRRPDASELESLLAWRDFQSVLARLWTAAAGSVAILAGTPDANVAATKRTPAPTKPPSRASHFRGVLAL